MATTLPQDVWALILAHVPQKDRLKNAALVSVKLSKAAREATTHITLMPIYLSSEQTQQRCWESFEGYVRRYASSHCTSMQLLSYREQERFLASLPCSKLCSLDVTGFKLQLGPHNGLPGVLSECAAGLTCLKLHSCAVGGPGAGSGLSAVSVLVNLRELQLSYVREQAGGDSVTLPGHVFASLKQLTHLHVCGVAAIEDVQQFSCLTNLSKLTIRGIGEPEAFNIVLPASLLELEVGSEGFVLQPSAFAAATQLTELCLSHVSVEGQGGGVSSGASLLLSLAKLQRLVKLKLRGLLDVEWPALPSAAAAYAGLTASSHLTELVVDGCGVPVAAWAHVFSHGANRLPSLSNCEVSELVEYGDEQDVAGGCLGSAAVTNLVSCCPNLQRLRLAVRHTLPAEIRQLTALECLNVTVDCTQDWSLVEGVARQVAALTSVRVLTMYLDTTPRDGHASEFAGALLPLTHMRQLEACDAKVGPREPEDHGDTLYLHACNQATPGQPPDTWMHLLHRLFEASTCNPAVTGATLKLVKQQEQYTEQLAVQEQQIAELQQQVVQQEQQVAQQEQQNAALQQQIAAQQQQIGALQQQVQQLLQLLPPPQ